MRVKTGQASSKYLGAFVFILLLFLDEVFPNAAFAFTTLNDCFKSKECLELIRGSSSSAVSAPTGVGYGVTTLRTTTSSGVIKTFVNGVADFAIVVGPSASYVSWHYWNEAHNGQAQNRARDKYCTLKLDDPVCGNTFEMYGRNENARHCNVWRLYSDISFPHGYRVETQRVYRDWQPTTSCGFSYYYMLITLDPQGRTYQTLGSAGPYTLRSVNPLPWKDWPQAKRDAAVALLNDADWQRLVTSMPVGGTLDPGDSVKAPKIGIPGQEWDNPNTPLDDRRFKSIPEEYPRPTFPDLDHDSDPDETDVDDDNDGFLDPYDPQPRNPAVPTANIESPPDQPSDPPASEPGEGATGEGAFSAEETLPYDPPSKVIGQLKPDSCVAASCRMAVYDSTSDDIPEAFLRDAAGVVKDEGAYLRDATNALAQYDIASHYEPSLSPEELKSATENGAAIVSVSTPITNGKHALIVDGFEGDYALIRDPLPEEKGAAYKIKTEKFMNAWTGEAVIIKP